MAVKKIPLRNDSPNYDFQIALDGVVYGFEFQWNERCACWTFDLKDASGNVLVGGVQVVVNYPILSRFKQATLPPGVLFFWDSTGAGSDPQAISDLGQRIILFYQEAATV